MPRALVVDDSATMRKVLIRSLVACGLTEGEVVEAGDGGEALRLFAEQTIDLVLTEWNMPGKSGLELIHEIRAGGAKVPIIMITTEAEKSRVIEVIRAGVTDYVIKPFTAEMLREKIEKVLGQVA
ncbi:MAG TPA: response regulator [Pirellulales bacterium]|nr:response regulator [Pirellulales bacterium]